MLDEIKEEPQGVAVVDLLRPEGVLVLVKYSAKITCFYAKFNILPSSKHPSTHPSGREVASISKITAGEGAPEVTF